MVGYADAKKRMEDLTKTCYERHKAVCEQWENGVPTRSWWDKDGVLCIEYENGKWGHYNDRGEWY